MSSILPYEGKHPKIAPSAFVAPNAVVIGEVEIGAEASIWFGAVVRGDIGSIRIGARTNIQDLACIHVTGAEVTSQRQANVAIGCDVTVGHSAVLHGCTVGDGCLIGIGAIVLDHAVIGDGAVVAAGALVPPRMVVPARAFVRGVPARVVGELTDEQVGLGREGAAHYVDAGARYRVLCAEPDEAEPACR